MRLRRVGQYLILAALAVIAAPELHAAKETNVWIPVDETVVLPCVGQVSYSGDMHVLAAVEINDRRVVLRNHVNSILTGTGPDGASYHGREISNSLLTFDAGTDAFPLHQSVVVVTTLNGHGQAPDLLLRAHLHTTITPDGTVTVSVDEIEVVCK